MPAQTMTRRAALAALGAVVLGVRPAEHSTSSAGSYPERRPLSSAPDLERAERLFNQIREEEKAASARIAQFVETNRAIIEMDPSITTKLTAAVEAYETARDARCMKVIHEVILIHPTSSLALDGVVWILRQDLGRHHSAIAETTRFLVAHHPSSSDHRVGRFVHMFTDAGPTPSIDAEGMKLVEGLAQSSDDTNRGQALLVQAINLREAFTRAEARGAKNAEELAQKAIAAFQKLATSRYAGLPLLVDHVQITLGNVAEQSLYRLEKLRVGQPLPEFSGEELVTKVAIGSGEYKGSVVMIAFWANWCHACLKKIPFERGLVQEFKGKPFVLLGVNGDEDRDEGAKAAERMKFPGRSVWNNASKTVRGKMTDGFDVQMWPHVVVVDANGIIRGTNVPDRDLKPLIKALIAEVPSKP
jgi:thiol-disulfide isomerase/thioredoxin